MNETAILSRIRLALAKLSTLFRNQSGAFRDDTGRLVRFGVGVGGSDLLGWTQRQIKLEDVGRTVAVFTAVEAKTDKELAYIRKHESELVSYQGADPKKIRYRDQLNFIRQVKEAGGIAGMASKESEAEDIIRSMNG